MFRKLNDRMESLFTTEYFTYKELRNMFFTLLLDGFFITVIMVLSTAMVSSAGENAIAAVSLVGTVNALIAMIFNAMCTGGAIVIARAKGSGDYNAVRKAIGETIAFVFLVALATTSVQFFCAAPIVDFLFPNVETILREYAIKYMRLIAISYLPLALFNVVFHAFRSLGDTKSSLSLTIIINSMHLVCSLIFINVLHLGVTGSGLSYIVARFIGAAAAFWWLFKFANPCHFRFRDIFHFSKDITRDIVGLGLPIALESALLQGGSLLVTVYLSKLTASDLAAHGVGNSILMLYYTPGNALLTLCSTVCGQCFGAKRYELVRTYGIRFIRTGRFLLLATVLILFPFTPLLMKLYNATEAAAPVIYRCLCITAVCIPLFWCDSSVTPMILRAAGDAMYATWTSVLTLAAGRVSLGYLLTIVARMGVPGEWCAMGVEWVMRAVALRLRLRGTKWLHIKKEAA